jgi:hypothetical protein
MQALTNIFLNLTTNEERILPNGLAMKSMSHPTHVAHVQLTISGVLSQSSICFVRDVADHPDNMPLTVLTLGLSDAFGACRVHVFGPNGAFAVGTLQDVAEGKQMLIISVRNCYKHTLMSCFERA